MSVDPNHSKNGPFVNRTHLYHSKTGLVTVFPLQVSCPLSRNDTPEILSNELVYFGFISGRDRDEMVSALTRVFVQRANEVAEYFAERMTSSNGNGNGECQSVNSDQLPNLVQRDPLKLHYHQPTPPGTKFNFLTKQSPYCICLVSLEY